MPAGRREIVEAHLVACRACKERLATFREVDDIIQKQAIASVFPQQRRTELHARLTREVNRRSGLADHLKLASSLLQRPLVAGLLVLLMLLAAVPAATEAGFPLGRFVHFGKVEVTQRLPLEEQTPIHHVDPSDPNIPETSLQAVAPAVLPTGLSRVERSVPASDRVELLYRNASGTAILITETPAKTGMVTLEATGTERAFVGGTEIVMVMDPRPEAVAALFWERDGIFFEVLVTEAPPGAYGGLRRADAFTIVEGLMDAQDSPGT